MSLALMVYKSAKTTVLFSIISIPSHSYEYQVYKLINDKKILSLAFFGCLHKGVLYKLCIYIFMSVIRVNFCVFLYMQKEGVFKNFHLYSNLN
jgi:hypothetical protein